jgi:hypothetical protein
MASLFFRTFLLCWYLVNAAAAFRWYEKHHHKKIEASIAASYPVEGGLDCEKFCLEMGDYCLAVNMIYANRRYVCDVIPAFPFTDDEVQELMTSNLKGKLIIKTE